MHDRFGLNIIIIIINPNIMVFRGIKRREISDLSLVFLCVLNQAFTHFKLVSAMTSENSKYLLTLIAITLRFRMKLP